MDSSYMVGYLASNAAQEPASKEHVFPSETYEIVERTLTHYYVTISGDIISILYHYIVYIILQYTFIYTIII